MSESEKYEFFRKLDYIGFDPAFMIQEMFLGYKWRKSNGKLYGNDKRDIPTKLIKMYYELNPDEITFECLKKAFVGRYIRNESKLEDAHSKEEIDGLQAMYEYVHSDDINFMFNVYTLKDLNKKLFSFTSHPECAGEFRKFPVYLPGTGTELVDWSYIRSELEKIDVDLQYLLSVADEVRTSGDADELLTYLDCCVEINCRLIKVHPFPDGNGRTIRAFTNKLLENVGLPPIYISANERGEYHRAMNRANNDGDYTDIKDFYRYKVCDSIVELDINDRLRKPAMLRNAQTTSTWPANVYIKKINTIGDTDDLLPENK